jgi:hypothetical protein
MRGAGLGGRELFFQSRCAGILRLVAFDLLVHKVAFRLSSNKRNVSGQRRLARYLKITPRTTAPGVATYQSAERGRFCTGSHSIIGTHCPLKLRFNRSNIKQIKEKSATHKSDAGNRE